MTTFVSRENIRDRLKTLYDAVDSWNSVYSGMPKWTDVAGESPILTIISDGSLPEFKGQNTNQLTHFYLLTNWVLYRYDDGTDTYTYDEAEDRLDALYTDLLQTIRDNAAGSTVASLIEPLAQKSEIRYVPVNNSHTYAVESMPVKVYLPTGTL